MRRERRGARVRFQDIHLVAAEALALRVTVPFARRSTVRGAAVGRHFREVERAVLAAGQGREIDVDGKFLVEELHEHVFPVGAEQVDAWGGGGQSAVHAHVVVHGYGAPGGGDAHVGVVSGGAGTGDAGGVDGDGVEDYGGVLLHAAAGGGAFPCWEGRVCFCCSGDR